MKLSKISVCYLFIIFISIYFLFHEIQLPLDSKTFETTNPKRKESNLSVKFNALNRQQSEYFDYNEKQTRTTTYATFAKSKPSNDIHPRERIQLHQILNEKPHNVAKVLETNIEHEFNSFHISNFTNENRRKTYYKQISVYRQKAHNSHINVNRDKTSDLKHRRKILIVTLYRSGSSFLGSLLTHMPKTFYSFEPLYFLHCNQYNLYLRNDTILTPNIERYLNMALDCNFKQLVNDSFRLIPHKNLSKRKKWIKKVGFPGYSSVEGATLACQDKSLNFIITKIIRAYHVQDVAPMMKDNVTIVHLIRDPRGMINSDIQIQVQQNLFKIDKTLTDIIAPLCGVLRTNLKFITKKINHYGNYKTNYVFLRYEDLALNPEEMFTKLYNYFQVNITQDDLQWLAARTDAYIGNPWSTHRNSRLTATLWRRNLPFNFVKNIQDLCADVITGFGYKLVDSEEMLTNMSVNIVNTIPATLRQNVDTISPDELY